MSNKPRTLCLELRPGRSIKIGADVLIELNPEEMRNVKLVFKAPSHVSIQRSERRKTYEELFADDTTTDRT